MPVTRRVGVLGGTLDPIHVGHLETARAARRALRLDEMMLMPAHVPPHRPSHPAASAYHRFAMAALAVQDLESATVQDDELHQAGPSYTAVTLERLARRFPGRELFFVTGADAFAEIRTWYRYPSVLDLAHFVVVSRPGVAASSLPDRLPELQTRMRSAPQPPEPLDQHRLVFLVDAPTPDVSSTEIRRRRRAAESIHGLVPGPVEAHILRHDLYVGESSGGWSPA